jgi:methylmalonyl-CoA/ethylmalonyl-CoA epimerase
MDKAMENYTYKKIDHLAIAVLDLEKSIYFYTALLGFKLLERRETYGEKTGMISAVLDAGNFTIVLLQGTQSHSQVSRYIEHYGPGVQHVAFEVKGIDSVAAKLQESGVQFATNVIQGDGLKQIFTKREPLSGMMIELIERTQVTGFQEQNVNSLFRQLEETEHF